MKLEWKTCLKVGISIFILYLCITYWSVVSGFISAVLSAASPLIIGFMLAYLVNILMSFYESHYFKRGKKAAIEKTRRPVCMLAAYLTLLAIIALIVGLIIPQLISCVQVIIAELPTFVDKTVKWIEGLSFVNADTVGTLEKALEGINWKSELGKVASVLTSGIGGVMDTVIKTVTSLISGIVTAFISIIFSVYLLSGRDKLLRQFHSIIHRCLKKEWYVKVEYVGTVLNSCFKKYIVGQCTEAVILGVLCTIGMLILRLPYATMIGALISFTALIPIAGAYIGAGIGAFMILTESPIKALIFLIFLIVLQQFEGNIIYPRVVGSSLGLPGIWVLAAVTIGGGIMGIPGMLFGVPVTAAIYKLLKVEINEPGGKLFVTKKSTE